MKFFNFSLSTLLVLISTCKVSGNPAPDPSVALLANPVLQLEATPSASASPDDRAWDFRLYKSHKCSGSAKNFTGSGTTDCRSDISGSISGFIRVDVDPRCDIMLYKDKKCSKGDSIGSIAYDTADTCTASRKKKKIKSFRVTCF